MGAERETNLAITLSSEQLPEGRRGGGGGGGDVLPNINDWGAR